MNKPTNKTLILGAGINNLVFPEGHFLCSWESFTKYFFNTVSPKNIPSTILMEETIRNISLGAVKSKKASRIEQDILFNIAENVKNSSQHQGKKNFDWILSNESITDIISLNFNLPFGIDNFVRGNEIEVKDQRIEFLNNCQFWKLKDESKSKIRFWFPHGNVSNPEQMVFGAHRYKSQTSYLSELFTSLKNEERNILSSAKKTQLKQEFLLKKLSNRDGFSWLAPFFYNELYFLGTSISADEWAMWSALTLRLRNFAKLENRKYEHPIFHMRSGTQNDTSYPHFIQPLYDPSMSYDDQWKKLEQDFRKEINTHCSQSKKNNKRPR